LLADVIRNKLGRKLQILSEKMKEMAGDIGGAISKTRDHVATAQSRFND
jgi:hypothetical protein